MTGKDIKNVAHSVQQRLLNLARQTGQDYNRLLARYAIERLVHRLALSPHADRFILKGAMLFAVWSGQQYRTTQDLDLLGQGENSPEALAAAFSVVAMTEVPQADGMVYLSESIRAEVIREDMKYEGVRVHLDSRLGNARVPLTIDVGFGDVITPGASDAAFPVLLGGESPRVRVYPRETVVAEKFEAMVSLGQPNSRMKDFSDIWFLSRHFEFDGKMLASAIAGTFGRRGTAVQRNPLALTAAFAADAAKHVQWAAFIRRTGPEGVPSEFPQIVMDIARFLGPVAEAIAAGSDFVRTWRAPGPWAARTDAALPTE